MGDASSLEALEVSVRSDLAKVEDLLRETAHSDDPLLGEAASFLINAGGKRFRPALLLTCGHVGQGSSDELVACAAAIELTHLATLYHDDVMDETSLRRGVQTAHRRYGNSRAILIGDFLFARASGLAASLGTYVSRSLAETIAELVEGQIAETRYSTSQDGQPVGPPSVEEHLSILSAKTASLIATSCKLGARLGKGSKKEVDAAAVYGRSIGRAFQIADDLLDIEGEESETGKTPGTDLREGVLTLAPLLTLSGEAEGGDELRTALDARDVGSALKVLRNNGSCDLARNYVRSDLDTALKALDSIDSKTVVEALIEFAKGSQTRAS